MDRVTEIRAEPWKIVAGAEVASQYDVPSDAWYFTDNRQDAALQAGHFNDFLQVL